MSIPPQLTAGTASRLRRAMWWLPAGLRLRQCAGDRHGVRRKVIRTAAYNASALAANAIGGIAIARALGATDRGAYAAIVAWFGIVLIVGDVGQTAATTYFVARYPDRARDYVATSRTMMVVTGVLSLGVGLVAAPWLAAGKGESALVGYRMMFAVCLLAFVGASYIFSLQAAHIARWNGLRAYQPLAFMGMILVLYLVDRLSLLTTLGAMATSIGSQTLFAYGVARRVGLTGGRPRLELLRPMLRYGASQLAAALPAVITARLDQLFLSLTVVPAVLGNYAIAASLTGLAQPLAVAFGAVAFPVLASRSLSTRMAARLQRRTALASVTAALVLLVPLAIVAPWLVPVVYGPEFTATPWLVVLLTPAGVCLAGVQVCGDLLRGYGQPLAVARVQLIAAAVTIILLATLVPWRGVAGAAVASTVAALIALLLMLREVRGSARLYEGPPVDHPEADGRVVTRHGDRQSVESAGHKP